MGQVKAAHGYEPAPSGQLDGAPRAQEQFGYGYDAAWNLMLRTNNALVQTFSVSALWPNELSSVSRPLNATITIAGSIQHGAAPVSVAVSAKDHGLGSATMYGDNTWALSGVTPSDGITTYKAAATDHSGNTSQDRVTVNLPVSANYAYDTRGNLTSDDYRNFNYDEENQLTNVYVANAWQTGFAYDGLGRRRIMREYVWQGFGWVETNEVRYLYDGYRVIQERDGNNTPLVTYTRGNDLSGHLEGAGGIGGLLARTDMQLLSSAYYHADGNGNVTCLIDQNNLVKARYSYDPFGNMLALSGTLAEVNVYRFSSKEWNANPGLYYYPYRYYDPSIQRWLNQDPIGERGGINLYAYVNNNPINEIDPDGNIPAILAAPAAWAAAAAEAAEAAAAATATATAAVGGAAIAAAGGVGYGVGTLIDQYTPIGNIGPAIGNWITPVNQSTSLPFTGTPGSTDTSDTHDGKPKQARQYGPDGYPITDTDYDHDHGQGKPHCHDWGRPTDGSPPTAADRGKGRPPTPSDPKHPNG